MANKEKDRLMEELFGKSRNLDLFATKDVLNRSENELSRIINQNKKTLESLRNELPTSTIQDINEEVKRDFNVTDDVFDLSKLKQELESDYGKKLETPENVVVGKASREVFETINKELNEIVVGQEQAVRELTIAFRRPYVTGSNPSKIRNSIILTGSNGSGRHLLVKGMATLLKQHGLIVSDEIITIDMQRYQSPSQENLFLQDLYVALNQRNAIIIIEKSEV